MCKRNSIADGEEAYRERCFLQMLRSGLSIKECLFLPLPCWGALSLWGWWFLATWRRGEHSLHERHTFNSGKRCCGFAWTYCRCLRRALPRSSLMYSDIRPWAKRRKSSVWEKTRQKENSEFGINIRYCCHLLASYGSANAKRKYTRGIRACE